MAAEGMRADVPGLQKRQFQGSLAQNNNIGGVGGGGGGGVGEGLRRRATSVDDAKKIASAFRNVGSDIRTRGLQEHELETVQEQLAQKLRAAFVEQLDGEKLAEMIDDVLTENAEQQSAVIDKAKKSEKVRRSDFVEKKFVCRRSLLTELLDINHIRAIYHIFIATLVLFTMHTFLQDIFDKGKIDLGLEMFFWTFGKFQEVIVMWIGMQFSTILIVYLIFYSWTIYRPNCPFKNLLDLAYLSIYGLYQLGFFVIPIVSIQVQELPPASSVLIASEQVRLMMKTHAFVRENALKVLRHSSESESRSGGGSGGSEGKSGEKAGKEVVRKEEVPEPDFSNYLYFLFAPTLLYRDSYPRTPTIRWSFVVSNFVQVVAALIYIYFICQRFIVPVFRNFSTDAMAFKPLVQTMFLCSLPGTLCFLISFFTILHSWMNAWAEMLRFGDRLFYRDWWNSTSFSGYFRTWNLVVHDWLYAYIYQDVYKLFPRSRVPAMLATFILSATVHEYIITLGFQNFYPVLFGSFAGGSVGLLFLTKNKRPSPFWNIFLWWCLILGQGVVLTLYSQEWFARHNCPPTIDNFADYFIPRSWFCRTL